MTGRRASAGFFVSDYAGQVSGCADPADIS